MADVLTRSQRKKCMSAIRGKDTKPELLLRKTLWKLGWRYRVRNNLPGRPDIVFPTDRIAIFIDGCFWHGCPEHFQQPETNAEFWKEKIQKNILRDNKVTQQLTKGGWTVLRFWEHDIKNSLDACIRKVIRMLKDIRARVE